MRCIGALVAMSAIALSACNDPGQTEIARGNVLASRRQFDGAIEAYQAAARADPQRARPRELLGHVLFDLHRYPEALAAYQDAERVEPQAALEARIGRARIDAEQGHLDDALATLGEVLTRSPDNMYALLSRANVAIRRGHPGDAELAIQDSAKAMQIDRKNASALYTRGCAFIAAKETDPGWDAKAEQAFHLLEQDHPTSPLPAYGRARISAARPDKVGVLSHLREAKQKAAQGGELTGGWQPDQVRKDPAFHSLKDDADFESAIGS
jgi:tetratricopeptide (TPR) repeat protein